MPESRLEYLFNRYVHQNCSLLEEQELMNLLAAKENKEQFQRLLDQLIENTDAEIEMADSVATSTLENIFEKDKARLSDPGKKTVLIFWKRMAAAAVIILFITGTIYWFYSGENKEKATPFIAVENEVSPILPGGNHAILTMDDGSKIVLDSIGNGHIQGGNALIKNQSGLLVYSSSPGSKETVVKYNTLTTPIGGQYQIVLSDGSKVWLNASSSLRFPISFIGKHREVELTGEGYFEIAKNKEKPFYVNVNGMQVEVLGTHFNVNAYGDEDAIKTSLLEGSVKINKGRESSFLKPGQQAVLKKNDDHIEIKNADMAEAVAWKNGLFQFNKAGIKNVMRQISRWYNVQIVYAGEVPSRKFTGKISRDAQLSDVLKILELTNVKFTIQGKKIIVK